MKPNFHRKSQETIEYYTQNRISTLKVIKVEQN